MPYERVQADPVPDAQESHLRPERRDIKRPLAKPAAAPVPVEYEALTGIDYPDGPDNLKLALAGKSDKVVKRIHLEPGDRSTDIPACDIQWMLDGGHIKAVK